jgi:hypothetical protein
MNTQKSEGDREAEDTVLTPEQMINTLIAALENEANAQDAPARINNIQNLIKILKVFFNLYSQGNLTPLLERDLPLDMRSPKEKDQSQS